MQTTYMYTIAKFLVRAATLKALFNNVFTFKNLSYMSLHAISVFDKV